MEPIPMARLTQAFWAPDQYRALLSFGGEGLGLTERTDSLRSL
jgi:hypothetical protein